MTRAVVPFNLGQCAHISIWAAHITGDPHLQDGVRNSFSERHSFPSDRAQSTPSDPHLRMTRAAGRLTPAASVDVAASTRTAPVRNAVSTIRFSSEASAAGAPGCQRASTMGKHAHACGHLMQKLAIPLLSFVSQHEVQPIIMPSWCDMQNTMRTTNSSIGHNCKT